MTPFSMRCNSCGEYIHSGKKFNARKEMTGDFYFKTEIVRFYIRCPSCAAEISFRTDPKNADYEAEHGAHRPYKSTGYRLTAIEQEEEAKAQASADETAMSKLEAKTLESQREMEQMDALDELRSRNARTELADSAAVLEQIRAREEREREEARKADDREIEEAAKAAFRRDEDGTIVRKVAVSDVPAVENKEAAHPTVSTVFKGPIKRKKPSADSAGVKKKAIV